MQGYADILQQQNMAKALSLADNQLSNDTTQSLVAAQGPIVTKVDNSDVVDKNQGVIELVPAEQMTTKKGDKATHAADLAMTRNLVYNAKGDSIKIPNVQELDSLMEEPLTALVMIAALNPDKTMSELRGILSGKGYKTP